MKLLGRYFLEIGFSSVSLPFYRGVVRRSAARAFGYYLFFTTLYGLVLGGIGIAALSRYWAPTIAELERKVPNFRVTISKGEFSTSLPQPLAVGDPDFLLVVDTSGRTYDLAPYRSAVVVSKTKAIYKKSALESREYYFATLPNFSLTSSQAIQWLKKYEQPILWGIFAFLALFLFPTIWFFVTPVILLFAVLLLIVAKILRSPLGYGQTLSIGFYAITLPTLIQTGALFLGKALGIGFWGLYLLWSLAALWFARRATP